MSNRVLHSFVVEISEPRPPSVNHMYRNGYHGRKVLSKEGEAFKAALQGLVVEECMTMPWKAAVDAVYCDIAWVRLTIGLHVQLYNASWKAGGKTPKGQRQSPYKKMDASNYIKVIEDAIVSGTGIDDSAHIEVTIRKLHDQVPAVLVCYEVLEGGPGHGV